MILFKILENHKFARERCVRYINTFGYLTVTVISLTCALHHLQHLLRIFLLTLHNP